MATAVLLIGTVGTIDDYIALPGFGNILASVGTAKQIEMLAGSVVCLVKTVAAIVPSITKPGFVDALILSGALELP